MEKEKIIRYEVFPTLFFVLCYTEKKKKYEVFVPKKERA